MSLKKYLTERNTTLTLISVLLLCSSHFIASFLTQYVSAFMHENLLGLNSQPNAVVIVPANPQMGSPYGGGQGYAYGLMGILSQALGLGSGMDGGIG